VGSGIQRDKDQIYFSCDILVAKMSKFSRAGCFCSSSLRDLTKQTKHVPVPFSTFNLMGVQWMELEKIQRNNKYKTMHFLKDPPN
jgi:hypothetical protein